MTAIEEATDDPVLKTGDNVIEPMGDIHSQTWCHEFDGRSNTLQGRIGYVSSTYLDPIFLDHLSRAIW